MNKPQLFLNKQQRIEYMRKIVPQLNGKHDVVLPVSPSDINDELERMDTYQEYAREQTSMKALTSDELG